MSVALCFFLLRLGFWMTLICLFLPSSRDDNRRLIRSAEQTVNDMRGSCQRNPQVCDDVRLSMTSIFARFKSGAELISDLAGPTRQGSRRAGRA